ncbi:hypothetical protein D3C81_1887570 [compost metagenome]
MSKCLIIRACLSDDVTDLTGIIQVLQAIAMATEQLPHSGTSDNFRDPPLHAEVKEHSFQANVVCLLDDLFTIRQFHRIFEVRAYRGEVTFDNGIRCIHNLGRVVAII